MPGMIAAKFVSCRRFLFLFIVASVLGGCSFFGSDPSPAAYGDKRSCSKGQHLAFPDFTIEFVGTRRVTFPQYPRGFLYYDFNVSHGSQKQTISWTGGTGLIGPMEFQVNGKKYVLERIFSAKRGKLGESELVISEGGL